MSAAKRAKTGGHEGKDGWTPTSWRAKQIKQQPEYPEGSLPEVREKLRNLPPIVHPAEVDRLKVLFREVAEGKRFILQGGDCAERFQDCSSTPLENKLKIILQMSLILIWGAGVPLVRVGRIAGQYSKPRSFGLPQFTKCRSVSIRLTTHP